METDFVRIFGIILFSLGAIAGSIFTWLYFNHKNKKLLEKEN